MFKFVSNGLVVAKDDVQCFYEHEITAFREQSFLVMYKI